MGKIGDLEIDFIAVKNDIKLYIQVSYLLSSKEVLARELEPLRQVKDAYPKYILSMDNKPASNIEGILLMNLLEFLLV